MAQFLTELSQLTGLPLYGTKIALGDRDGSLTRAELTTKDGALIGYRSGYLVAIGVVRAAWTKSIGVVVRFPSIADPEALKRAVKQAPELKKLGVAAAIGPKILICKLPWRFGFKAAKVGAVLDALLAVVSQFATIFKPRACEDCGQAADIILVNRVPAALCSRCQGNVAQAQQEKRAAYTSLDADYATGVFCGLGGGLIYSLVWGGGGYWLDHATNGIPLKLLAIMPFIAAILVPKFYSVGAKKVTTAGIGITIVLTAAALVAGDALFFGLHVARVYSVPLWAAFKAVLHHLSSLKTAGTTEQIVSAMDVIAALGSGHVLWQLRPKFKADVQRLDMPRPAPAAAAPSGAS